MIAYPGAVSVARVFVARLAGLSVFDPLGDEVGRVRDVVVSLTRSLRTERPRAVGLVVEVPGRRRVFVPMTRVTSMDAGQVVTTGLVNLRRFEQRATETLVLAELLDRQVTVLYEGQELPAVVEDVALERRPGRDWVVSQVFARAQDPGGRSGPLRLRRRRGDTMVVPVDQVRGLHLDQAGQGVDQVLAAYQDLKPADLAAAIRDLTPKRRAEVAEALRDETLADVLEELPDDDRVEILTRLPVERAADVLEAMQPDDATDLLSELPAETVERLLQLMEPDEAEPIRRLLRYEDDTAGGMMTTEPVILAPEASIAEALALVRREELTPALASMVFVARSPLETPTGTLLGVVHGQRLLREPPHQPVGSVLDKDVEPVPPEAPLATVTRQMATYNMLVLPVTDADGRLLGAVSVDDVLDHILPEDWREDPAEGAGPDRTDVEAAR